MKKLLANIFSSIGRYFNKLFTKAKVFLNKEIPVAIAVVDALKTFMDSPLMPFITQLIPGEVDDKIAARIRTALPKILVDLKIARDCTQLSSNDAIIQCAINHLRSLQPTARYGYWLMIASHLSYDLTDGKLSWAEIVTLVQSVKNPEINTSK